MFSETEVTAEAQRFASFHSTDVFLFFLKPVFELPQNQE